MVLDSVHQQLGPVHPSYSSYSSQENYQSGSNHSDLLVDKLKVLDRGDGEPWDPAVPTMLEHRAYLPGASPKKRARDSAVDAVFNNFGKASPSTSKRHKRNAAGTQ
ncbi:hypothetical protein MVEN_02336400 [Mycena venus]|uniref:Uncharacterized protein n=1 Tax=Mycena venus TaxID=2733690 RepID=A0A8H6X4C7_9AGAR|nr:hypothetical protein MVEN_02336400 [Mycena venus]